ncbi:helix-turn-helix domain-containing protein [Phenylobacterium sp.]|uniref:helix-turn-helix domain-containing protein n=1 Tax=Phenylobacterium sp. TaxID=1871053 RepID=UPI00356A3C76
MDDSRINSEVGRRLRSRRRLMDMSQKEVAQRCGLTFQQIHKYESGVNRISVAKLILLAHALDLPASYFLEGLGVGLDRNAVTGPPVLSVVEDSRFSRDAA